MTLLDLRRGGPGPRTPMQKPQSLRSLRIGPNKYRACKCTDTISDTNIT